MAEAICRLLPEEDDFLNELKKRGYDAYWNDSSKIVMVALGKDDGAQDLQRVIDEIGWYRSYGIVKPVADISEDAAEIPLWKARLAKNGKTAPGRTAKPKGAEAKPRGEEKKRDANLEKYKVAGQLSFADCWPNAVLR